MKLVRVSVQIFLLVGKELLLIVLFLILVTMNCLSTGRAGTVKVETREEREGACRVQAEC